MPVYSGSSKTRHKIFFVTEKIKKVYAGNQKVYSAGSMVTYRVDSGVTYREEVDSGASCLSPKSFTPAKSGYAFLGWRTDNKPEAGVCGSLVMEDTPITLYAVFRKTVTVTFYNGTATASKQTGYQYYNNGNLFNPSFKLTQASLSGWYPRGWSGSPNPDGSVLVDNGAAFTQTADLTLYGLYYATVTLTTSVRGTVNNIGQNAYYNSSGQITWPSFTVQNPTASDAAFKGWSVTAGSAAISYGTFTNIGLSANLILYAVFKYNDVVVNVARAESVGGYPTMDTIVLSGIDTKKYYAITGKLVDVWGYQNFASSAYAFSIILEACGIAYTLGSTDGSATSIKITNQSRTFNFGNGSNIRVYSTRSGSTGGCGFYMTNAVLLGNTVIG